MISVLIVDDEPLARTRIRRMLETSEFQVCGEAADGSGALIAIQRLFPDVVLLDIRMPGTDGMAVAHQISDFAHPPAIIFVTAYDEYALKAFRVKAENYLLKPVRKEDLLAALRAVTQLNKAQLNILETKPAQTTETLHIACRNAAGIKRIAVSDVIYLQAEHKYVTVFHLEGESLCDQSLKELEHYLQTHVLRIHRNTLINQHRLERLQRTPDGQYLAYLRGFSQGLAVSRRMVADVKKFMVAS